MSDSNLRKTFLPLAPLFLASACAGLVMPSAVLADTFITTVLEGETTTFTHILDAPAVDDVHTLSNAGTIRGTSPTAASTMVLTSTGAGRLVVNNDGRIQGRIDFSTLQGGVTFNNNSPGGSLGWNFTGNVNLPNRFSAGDDVINNAAGAVITGNGPVYFGDGYDVIANQGTLSTSATMVFFGLERIDNDGTLVLRMTQPELEDLHSTGSLRFVGAVVVMEDLKRFSSTGTLEIVDVLSLPSIESGLISGSVFMSTGTPTNTGFMTGRLMAPGADFVSDGSSRLTMDALLAGGFQETCSLSGSMQSDCINLAGGSTSGTTLLTVNSLSAAPGQGGAYSQGITLIDVSGGQTQAGHFVLDPESPNFNPDAPFGGGIMTDDGLFSYSLFHDADTQTHRLIGIPSADFMALGALPVAVQTLWRVSDEASSARQVELRLAKSDAAGGFWVKAANGDAERDAQMRFSVLGLNERTSASYEQNSRAITFGADVVGAEGESGYALGISVGDVKSEVEFDRMPTRIELGGFAINLYGSYRSGNFFVDLSGGGYAGNVEGNFVSGSNAAPIEGKFNAFGARFETGLRFAFGDSAALEPLASLIYVRSGLNDIERLPGATLNGVQFDATSSLRGGIGARGAFQAAFGSMKLGASLTGKIWSELAGESTSKVRTRIDALPLTSRFDGTFTEVSATVDLLALNGAISSFIGFSGQFGEDYDSTTGTLGLRYNW